MVDGDARSELLSADWNDEWMRLQADRHRADDPFEWDKRARHFRPLETAPYARDFMKLLALKPGESVLDMGCGAGSIAIPLAQAGHPVIAADFSPAMLGTLDAGIEYYGLEDRITPLELAWDDDWDLVGPVAKAVDIAFASRSVTTTNLKGALAKLDRTARRRCAVTMVANSSPRYDLHLMNAIGASVTCSNGFVYAFNILIQMGALPQVTYFESPRRDTFDSLEAGVADFSRMLEHGNEDKVDCLRDYIAQHMIETPMPVSRAPRVCHRGAICSIMSVRFVGRLLHGIRSLHPAHSLFAARTAHSLGIRILFELGKRAPHCAVPALSWDSSRRLRPRRGAPHT
ncbi:methyltransferase domain-containing protein [Collinsella aerofaciens]|uniref:methyltransferase domain-containing protein n=1 Tax=Collinsella aerofaciens TaxID=74426 RepID=UPI0034A2BEA1